MKSTLKTLLSLALLATPATALASSHREAPAISNDPQADNTDLWAWADAPGTANQTVHIVASYIPLEEPSGGPNYYKFSDDVLYQIHIGRGDATLADAVTYSFRFTTAPVTPVPLTALPHAIGGGQEFFTQLAGTYVQTYTVTKTVAGASPVVIGTGLQVAPPNIGQRTDAIIYNASTSTKKEPNGVYDDAFTQLFVTPLTSSAGAEGKVFAGPRDDGFYVYLGGVFDLANIGTSHTSLSSPVDNIAGYNTHTIALDIPVQLLTFDGNLPAADGTVAATNDKNTLAIWASASRPKVNILRNDGTHVGVGPWVQVSRLGLPLINEAVIGLQDKDKYNRTTPRTDIANFAPYFLNPVIVKDAEAVGIYGSGSGSAYEMGRTDIINVINLTNDPTMGAHAIAAANDQTGDVLRVDLGLAPGFPNGRSISASGVASNTEDANVTDVELSLLLLGATSGVVNGASHNDATYLTAIPYLAVPWRGLDQGHGKPTP